MEDIDSICSLDSKLSFSFLCSVKILDIFEVIVKTSFFENHKIRNQTFSNKLFKGISGNIGSLTFTSLNAIKSQLHSGSKLAGAVFRRYLSF